MMLRKLSVTMGVIFGFAASAMATDLPKEGTFSGTYTGFGTYRTIKIGSDRALNVFDENGAELTNGFADHMTWHCWGTGEVANGEAVEQGYCVGTDPTGDLLEAKVADAKHPLMAKTRKATVTYVAGTGKFTGISGAIEIVLHAGFRPLIAGTYVIYATEEGSYKLP